MAERQYLPGLQRYSASAKHTKPVPDSIKGKSEGRHPVIAMGFVSDPLTKPGRSGHAIDYGVDIHTRTYRGEDHAVTGIKDMMF